MSSEILYSDIYSDDVYEYRHVILPSSIYRKLQYSKMYNETEWRSLGIQMSRGWIHYSYHIPEPNIMLFKRPSRKNNPISL